MSDAEKYRIPSGKNIQDKKKISNTCVSTLKNWYAIQKLLIIRYTYI